MYVYHVLLTPIPQTFKDTEYHYYYYYNVVSSLYKKH